jgi:CyaY protein
MDATGYLRAAEACLERVVRWLGDEEDLDLTTGDGLVSIEFDDGARFVVNRQSAARQIWLAAGARAWHYDLDAASGAWRDDRDGHRLDDRLSELVSDKLGRRLVLTFS